MIPSEANNNRIFEIQVHKIDIKIVSNLGDLVEASMKISRQNRSQDKRTSI